MMHSYAFRLSGTLPDAVTPNRVTTLSAAMLLPAAGGLLVGQPAVAAAAVVAQDFLVCS